MNSTRFETQINAVAEIYKIQQLDIPYCRFVLETSDSKDNTQKVCFFISITMSFKYLT